MNGIITVLVVVILGLFGINVMKSKKIRNQKEEIKTQDIVIEKKKEEMRTINEVQTKINEAKSSPAPGKKEAPATGDSDSRLERLNKLHSN
jgi:cell division protein FtsN